MLVNETEGSTYAIINKMKNEDRIVLDQYRTLPTPQFSEQLTVLMNDLYQVMVQVITGDDISEFDKAVEKWYADGGEALTQEVNEWYAASKS